MKSVVWALCFGAISTAAFAGLIATGDVMVSLRNGTIQERTQTGVLVQTLTTDRTGELTGSAFDSSGNFYQTAGFSGGDVVKFSPTGTYLGTFGSGYSGHPESLVFDSDGNVFVGQADTNKLLRLSATGALVNTYTLSTQNRGTDWVDLASDEHTIYYTSEGPSVEKYNTQTNTQLPIFSNVGGTQYAFRLLNDGGLLVANTTNVLRLNAAGAIIQTYLPGSGLLFALNLDPDGHSFWTAEYFTGIVRKIDYNTGAIEQQWNVGQGISGLSVKGEITISNPNPTPEPSTLLLGCGSLIALYKFRRRTLPRN